MPTLRGRSLIKTSKIAVENFDGDVKGGQDDPLLRTV
jgi:hypothetical protein